MIEKDRDYFLERAVKERSMAMASDDNAVALAHSRFADEYERRAAALREGSSSRPIHRIEA